MIVRIETDLCVGEVKEREEGSSIMFRLGLMLCHHLKTHLWRKLVSLSSLSHRLSSIFFLITF